MSLILLIPVLLEILLFCLLLFICALFVKYVHLLAVIAYLGRGKATEPYEHESGDGNRRAGRVGGEDASFEQISRGEGDVGTTYLEQRTVRGVLRGSCWVECDSDEEYSSEDEDSSENGYSSEDEMIESSKDHAQWKDGGEDIQSELALGVDTPATSCFGHSTAFSLSGVASRRRRRDRDGEEQEPSHKGPGGGD